MIKKCHQGVLLQGVQHYLASNQLVADLLGLKGDVLVQDPGSFAIYAFLIFL